MQLVFVKPCYKGLPPPAALVPVTPPPQPHSRKLRTELVCWYRGQHKAGAIYWSAVEDKNVLISR